GRDFSDQPILVLTTVRRAQPADEPCRQLRMLVEQLLFDSSALVGQANTRPFIVEKKSKGARIDDLACTRLQSNCEEAPAAPAACAASRTHVVRLHSGCG